MLTNYSNLSLDEMLPGSELVYCGGVATVRTKKYYDDAPKYVETVVFDETTLPHVGMGEPRAVSAHELVYSDPVREFISSWGSVLTKVNAEINKTISPNTALEAAGAMFMIFTVNPHLVLPEIVIGNDGGVDIEWNGEDELISIHVGPRESGLSRIYCETEGKYTSVQLNHESLTEIFG